MCGLVGIAGKLAFADEKPMQALLLNDYIRGKDSTGFASVTGGGDIRLAKIASHPLDLFDSIKFRSALSGSTSRAFIGHNRAATRGGVNAQNAHPFIFDHIVGAHNGTLTTETWRALETAAGDTYAVDSAAIFACIAKIGIDETMKLMEEGRDSSTGAWSLTWYDTDEGTMNFLRNKHRPMWLAYHKDFSRVYWASEYPMIEYALKISYSGEVPLHASDKGYQFFQTEEDVHYRFKVADFCDASPSKPKPTVKTLKGKEPAPVGVSTNPFSRSSTTNGGTNGSGDKTNIAILADHQKKNGLTTTTHGTERPNVLHFVGDDAKPFAGVVTDIDFYRDYKHGCDFCGAKIDFGDKGTSIFTTEQVMLCQPCGGIDPTTNRIYVKNLDEYVQ